MIARRKATRIGLALAAWMAAATLAEAKTMLIYIRGGKVVHTVLLDANIDCKSFQPASSDNIDVVYCESGLKMRKAGTNWDSTVGQSRAPRSTAGFEATWRSAPSQTPAPQADTVPLRASAAAALSSFPGQREIEMIGDAELRLQVETAQRGLQDLAAGRSVPPAGLVIALERADLLERLGLGRELGERTVGSSP